MGGLTARPGSRKSADEFISAAPDGGGSAAAAPAQPAADVLSSGARKKPISLTIDAKILAELDRKAGKLGLSRAAAFALAVSRFIAAEDREANR
jgi:hypothetical protein